MLLPVISRVFEIDEFKEHSINYFKIVQ
jgi:hypothetical protein